MKMYMPLIAAEDGIAQFVKQPGTSLNTRDILSILTLAILEDSSLPYSEIYFVLSVLSGRMPAKLEELVRATIDASKAKNAEFPTCAKCWMLGYLTTRSRKIALCCARSSRRSLRSPNASVPV